MLVAARDRGCVCARLSENISLSLSQRQHQTRIQTSAAWEIEVYNAQGGIIINEYKLRVVRHNK